ncbi:hypothetical protein [Achromobacter anxifer]|uniref:hypothetical protein n=1 Tax=Achromobacter anxifer TaxID=1287737 RepID=UPI001591ED4F|nr:hypothetical protein [Achromobacter anxifer]
MTTANNLSRDELLAAQATAGAYAKEHLRELAADVDSLHRTGELGPGSRLEQLVQRCRAFAGVNARGAAHGIVNAGLRHHVLSTAPAELDVDALAQEIRRVDGAHSLGAGALAEALLPFLTAHGVRGGVITLKDLREAFDEGFSAPQTYNDVLENNADEAWTKSDTRRVHDAALRAHGGS